MSAEVPAQDNGESMNAPIEWPGRPDAPPRGGLLDQSRARRWLGVVEWGVRTGLYTYERPLQGKCAPHVRVADRPMLMMSSYDYLGLIGHPEIETAAVEAIRTYGTGSGGVRLLTGTTELHRALDADLAAFKGTEAALSFSSGFLANLAAVSALVGPHDRVILDAYAHRSLVDACRLARAPFQRFSHNDPASLDMELRRPSTARRTLVIVEGVYSMDGDLCPLPDIIDLKRRHGAYLMVDEAHSFGVLGHHGRGIDEHYGLDPREVDLWAGSLSKAIPSTGGFLAGAGDIIQYLKHESAPYFFSAAACPASVAAARAALRVVEHEPQRRIQVMQRARQLRDNLKTRGISTGKSSTPIVPVLIGTNEDTWTVARRLEDEGILASAVVPPAVPRGAARLRLCCMATHSENDIARTVETLAGIVPSARHDPAPRGERTAPPR